MLFALVCSLMLGSGCQDVPPLDADAQARLSVESELRAPEPDPALQDAAQIDVSRRISQWATWLDSTEDSLFADAKAGLLRYPARSTLHFSQTKMPQSVLGRRAAYEVILRFVLAPQGETGAPSSKADAYDDRQRDQEDDGDVELPEEAEGNPASTESTDDAQKASNPSSTETPEGAQQAQSAQRFEARKPSLRTWARAKLTQELAAREANQTLRPALTSLQLQALAWIERIDKRDAQERDIRADAAPIVACMTHPVWDVRRSAADYLSNHPEWINRSHLEELATGLYADDVALRTDVSSLLLRLHRVLTRSEQAGASSPTLTYNPVASLPTREQQAARLREWINQSSEEALRRYRESLAQR